MHLAHPEWSGLFEEYMDLSLAGSQEIDAVRFQAMVDSSAIWQAMLLMLGGELLLVVWFFITWGAYRQVNEVSKNRSVIAMFLLLITAWPHTMLMSAVQHSAGIKLF